MKGIGEQTTKTLHSSDSPIPYPFSSTARAIGQDLRIGDYVRVLGLDDKYELTDIFWEQGSVRVRRIGRTDELYLPLRHVRPWQEETSR